MNPNTQHQTWARWTFIVHAHAPSMTAINLEYVRQNCARFFGLLTRGSAATLNIQEVQVPENSTRRFVVELLWDRREALDQLFIDHIGRKVGKFFYDGFGPGTTCHLKPVKIVAGNAEDGKPPAQLIILPTIESTAELHI